MYVILETALSAVGFPRRNNFLKHMLNPSTRSMIPEFGLLVDDGAHMTACSDRGKSHFKY
jgi:hypothetical protein